MTTGSISTRQPSLRRGGVFMIAAAFAWVMMILVGLLVGGTEAMQALFEYESEREGLVAIGEHTSTWHAMHVAMALGAVLGLMAFVTLYQALKSVCPIWLLRNGLIAAIVGTAAWLVEVGGRMTVVAARGRAALEDPSIGGDGTYVGFSLLLFLLMYLALAAFALFGWTLAHKRLPGRVRGTAIAVVATLAVAAAMTGAVPLIAYVGAGLPMGMLLTFSKGGTVRSKDSRSAATPGGG